MTTSHMSMGLPWLQMIGNLTTVNTTPAFDVLVHGCVRNFNTVACIRSSILASLSALTAILCALKVFGLHHVHHRNWHQYFIFYCAFVECTIAAVQWVVSTLVQVDFVLQWLKLAQFLVMCHFYWTRATRALRREIWTARFLVPFLAGACTYFTIVTILGIVYAQDTFLECIQPYWIMMSSAEFIIVQLFCVAGFYITRRLNEISTLESVRTSQKRDLWCVVIVFEASALFGLMYDLTLKIIGDTKTGCSAIFLSDASQNACGGPRTIGSAKLSRLNSISCIEGSDVLCKCPTKLVLNRSDLIKWSSERHTQELYSVIYSLFMLFKLLLPIWVMLVVFQPLPEITEIDDVTPILNDDLNSGFSNADDVYGQLYHPRENYSAFVHDTSTYPSPVSGFLGPSPRSLNIVSANGNAAEKLSKLETVMEESGSRVQTPEVQTPEEQPVIQGIK